MERKRLFHSDNLHSHGSQQLSAVVFVKYVVVKAAVLEVAKGTSTEIVKSARGCVHLQIVAAQDFFKVRKVVFLRISLEIPDHMGDRSQSPAMIEGLQIVRQNQNQTSARSKYSLPLFQRFDRVGEVFKIVRREYEIVTCTLDIRQVGAITKEGPPWALKAAKSERVGMRRPCSCSREVAVIKGAYPVVDEQRPIPTPEHF